MKVQNWLTPFSPIYGAAVKVRRELFRAGIFNSFNLEVPVVSVGNITVGGTGKTPLVAWAAKVLAENGYQVCILTRGYKRENSNERVLVSNGERLLANARQAGDEAVELANKLIGVSAVIADKNRVEAGIWARENLGVTAFVLDDGFQHWRLQRDLDIVTIDATNPFGNRKLLPAGILREPLTSLKRADAVVITRADLSNEIPKLTSEISRFNANCPILLSNARTTKIEIISNYSNAPSIEQSLKSRVQIPISKPSFAFCGLGNPAGFFEHLRREGFIVQATKAFPDHYAYTQKDIAEIETAARANGAKVLLTTAKDAVKLADLKFNLPCFVVEIAVEFDDESLLRKLLNEIRRK